jgi:hypothetical protein
MIARDGRLKILDFGLAKVAQSDAAIDGLETRTDAGLILGTCDLRHWPSAMRAFFSPRK